MEITFGLLRATQRLSGGRRGVCRRSGDGVGPERRAGQALRDPAHQAPAQPLRLLLEVGDMKGLRGRRPETDRRAQVGPERRGIVHHRCGFPERTRFPEDVCRTASRSGRDLGHRLFAPSAISPMWRPGSFRACSNPSALSWCSGPRIPVRPPRHGFGTGQCRGEIADTKFAALGTIELDDQGWSECPTGLRASFLPRVAGVWAEFAALENLFAYNGSGVMPGRTWVVAPDRAALERQWEVLQSERDSEMKERLFHPHLLDGTWRKRGASDSCVAVDGIAQRLAFLDRRCLRGVSGGLASYRDLG